MDVRTSWTGVIYVPASSRVLGGGGGSIIEKPFRYNTLSLFYDQDPLPLGVFVGNDTRWASNKINNLRTKLHNLCVSGCFCAFTRVRVTGACF